ncbi:MAG: M20/M25/M40 family metallo-hydrolase [Labilithrix sp.]
MRAGIVLLALAACATPARMPANEPESTIHARALLGHIGTLSSERFEGRAPGTSGEDLTVEYLQSEMKKSGLAPGNPDGTWVQTVPLAAITSRATLAFDRDELRPVEDFVAWSLRTTPEVRVRESEVVFVGHGISAPERGWNDLQDVDVKGKTVVFLVGDPFGGPMTYYGRWTYKFEIAARLGAAAALIVHETGPAGYGWNVVSGGAKNARYEIDDEGSRDAHVGVEGWIHESTARRLIPDFDRVKAAARRPGFRPIPLSARATISIDSTSKPLLSRNVVGRVVGTDLKEEHVVFSSHWDHFGRNEAGVFHGALDNAAGVAWLLETARAFTSLPALPRRSILFMATTAEESGLLGAKFYAAHPLYPLEKTVANVNMDIPNPWGRTRSVVSLGLGQTTMDAMLADEAAKQGRQVIADPEGEKGYYFRSDHFEFAKHGVPALGFLFPGADYRDQPPDFGKHKRQDFVAHRYHSPNDVIAPDWDLAGMVEDTVLLFRVGRRLANEDRTPEWSPGAAFRR